MNPQEVMRAIRELREHVGLSQTAFIQQYFKKTLPTQQRWEKTRPPRGATLIKLVHISREKGRDDLAEIFKHAAIDELPPGIRELIHEQPGVSFRKRAGK